MGISAWALQVTKYVSREIVNHRYLMHPHVVQFKEVCPLDKKGHNCLYCRRLISSKVVQNHCEPFGAAKVIL